LGYDRLITLSINISYMGSGFDIKDVSQFP